MSLGVRSPNLPLSLVVEELTLSAESASEVIILDTFKDEWDAALARARREEREWGEALRRVRLGSETPRDLGVQEEWDEDEEWALRIALAREGLSAPQRNSSLDDRAVQEPFSFLDFDDDKTVEFEPPPELLALSESEDLTRKVVIPMQLLRRMAR